ncbi:MAG: VWA domain-containing protein [Chloroflexota bacterium]|nr:VWA domain-containing protein [Chloroflexota bacterium]
MTDKLKVLENLLPELEKFPAPVKDNFNKAIVEMPDALSDEQASDWLKRGIGIAGQTVRSWEAAAHFFQVSPNVISSMPYSYFVRWMECGATLCEESPTLAAAYFEASPATMSKLRSRHIESWAGLGDGLYKGTWKSSTLACRFFAESSTLLESLSFQQLENFANFLDALSHRSYDLSSECLTLGEQIFPLVGDDKDAFLSLATTLVDTGWREVKSFFEAGAKALPKIHPEERMRFLKLAESLVNNGGTNIPGTMLDISQSLSLLEEDHHYIVLGFAETLLDEEPLAMPEFIKSAPIVLEKLTILQLGRWYQEGVNTLSQNKDGGLAFFKIESSHSEAVIETLSSGIELDRIKPVMEMYCRALAGAEVKLSPTDALVEKNIGWVSNESPTTEGSTVFVPTLVDRYGTKEENYAWFKVVSTHQVAHLEFGSFIFEFERPSGLFENLRLDLEARRIETLRENQDNGPAFGEDVADSDSPGNELSESHTGLERAWLTDMQRFFDLFEDRKLSLDIFTVVEDGRLDARVKNEYPGIKSSYTQVQSDSHENRPDIKELPAREAMVEFMVRLSLQQYEGVLAPSKYNKEASQVAQIARRVLVPDATVEDTAEATLRIYAIISAIPNEEIPPDDWSDMDFDEEDDEDYVDPEDMENLLQQIGMGMEMELRPEGEEEYESIQEVEYRGDFKPELAQLMTELRMQQQDEMGQAQGEPLTQEQLQELLENSAELDLQATQGEIQESSGMFADNIMKEAGANMPQSPDDSQGPFVHVDEEGGELEPPEPETFVYDEWDFRAEDYKPRWCVVRQKMMQEGEPAYFGATLNEYSTLVTRIRRQFEMMVPEMFRKERKLIDGEDIDIDDVIENMVDIKTGSSPDEKFYWRRNKVQRDVAVAFLLDTSASTAEAIDEGKNKQDDWDAPDDPVEYMVWLRTRRGEQMRRSYKRIIDMEKESMVLLINALEAIGDTYGIYGFSGYGRENVEFYTVKDLHENFSEKVKRRIDRIAPLHATRMGPAIRHATYKLDNTDARTKILFLISDGRPQDRGYSREGVEKEYAVHDTKKALDEAKMQGINSFCLTVDKNGHDYLKTMCSDMGYEILDDINDLPERLLVLYRRLTM